LPEKSYFEREQKYQANIASRDILTSCRNLYYLQLATKAMEYKRKLKKYGQWGIS
jgi:hypothetical protein